MAIYVFVFIGIAFAMASKYTRFTRIPESNLVIKVFSRLVIVWYFFLPCGNLLPVMWCSLLICNLCCSLWYLAARTGIDGWSGMFFANALCHPSSELLVLGRSSFTLWYIFQCWYGNWPGISTWPLILWPT